MDSVLKIIGLVIFAAGAASVYAAEPIVRKFKLAEKQKSGTEDYGSEEELQNYKTVRAIVSVKKAGMLLALPGLVLLLIKL